jgi:hypothetical protein
MNPKFFIIAAVLGLGLFAASTFAQNDMDAARRQMNKDLEKQYIRADLLNGLNAKLEILQMITSIEPLQKELGLTQDQSIELLKKAFGNMDPILQNDPVYKSLRDKRDKVNEDHPSTTVETYKQFVDLRAKMLEIEQKTRINLINETYTPEQMKIINEFHISNMSETRNVFPRMFEALDLSDEQKQQLDEIQKEIQKDPIFEKHVDSIVEYNLKYREKQFERIDAIWKTVTDHDERIRLRDDQDAIKRMLAGLKPEWDRMMESGKELTTELKIKMFDVLTDEQWERLLKLTDDPPEYVRKAIAQNRKDREEIDSLNRKPGVWMPGPNSWRPGDPIPEQYGQQRNERRGSFPRSETPVE